MTASLFSGWNSVMDILVFGGFFALALVAVVTNLMARNTKEQKQSVSNANFLAFQKKFFLVYFLALFGDWLQGPYVYKLYDYYGFRESQIAVLYVTGFASSVLFGTATGPLADKVGRKKVTILFCIIYFFCCLTKLSPSYWILMIGRVFGGIATSMLFSTFESWYVYEHTEHYGFPAEWIGVTFTTTTFFNGLLAIIAGVVSNFTAEGLGYGPVSPFVVACAPLVVCGVIVSKTWNENYGNRKPKLMESCMEGFHQITNDRVIFILGGIQTMVESCMYIFVFLWTPVLMPANPPLGMVFACFMVAIMIGSSGFALLLSRGYKAEEVLRLVLIILVVTLGICTLTATPNAPLDQIYITYGAFIVLEVAIGMYFPAMSFCKSQVIPESHRANVMNWFRVPMNIITCSALLCLHVDWIAEDKRVVFGFCMGLAALGVILATKFISAMKLKNSVATVTEEKQGLMEESI